MDCNRVEEQLSAYLLGALDSVELRALDSHIDACGRCRRTLSEHGEITENLTYGARQLDPPARIKQRLMSRIEAYQGHSPAGFAAPISRLLSALGFSPGTYSGMAAAAPYQLYRTYPAAMPGLAVEELVAAWRSDGARGMLLAPRSGRTAHVAAFGLPPLPVGLVYRVWVVTDQRRYDGGSFTVDPTGYGYVDLRLPTALAELHSITVTIERADGDRGVDSNTTTIWKDGSERRLVEICDNLRFQSLCEKLRVW